MITSKRKRNKSAGSAWTKERYRSKFKTRMVGKKAQKPIENTRIEKEETDSPGQRNQSADQVNSGQRDEIRKSQMEQSRENIPEQIYVPQKPIIQMHPIQMPNPYQNYQKE